MLKINDILTCKTSLRVYISNNDDLNEASVFDAGKNYKIINIFKETIFINDSNEEWTAFFLIKQQPQKKYFYIWDYFYKEKELRKIKLEKLENWK